MRTKKPADAPPDANAVDVAAYPDLAAWLEQHAGKRRWQRRIGRNTEQAWTVHVGTRAALVFLVLYPRREGWELFTADFRMDPDGRLADANDRLGFAPYPDPNAQTVAPKA